MRQLPASHRSAGIRADRRKDRHPDGYYTPDCQLLELERDDEDWTARAARDGAESGLHTFHLDD